MFQKFVTYALAAAALASLTIGEAEADRRPDRQQARPDSWVVRDPGRCFDDRRRGRWGACVRGVDPDPNVRSMMSMDRERGDGGDDPQ